jgi:hypothetical protein
VMSATQSWFGREARKPGARTFHPTFVPNVYRAQPCELCDRDGSPIPFARTRTEARRCRRPPSLEERYGSRKNYVTRVEAAAAAVVYDRLLLPADHAGSAIALWRVGKRKARRPRLR